MDLDHQLNGKSDFARNEREEDKKFAEYLKKRQQEMAQKDHQSKMNKLMSRKQIEEENQHRLEEIKTSSRIFRNQNEKYTGLVIGARDEFAKAEK